MPEREEWTTKGRRPSSSRARTTDATFFQLLTLETLVPPNLRTTQWESVGLVIERSPSAPGVEEPGALIQQVKRRRKRPSVLSGDVFRPARPQVCSTPP